MTVIYNLRNKLRHFPMLFELVCPKFGMKADMMPKFGIGESDS